MKRTDWLLLALIIAITVAVMWYSIVHGWAQQPQPSYQLPQSGTITNWGPDGVTIYHYSDHGRTYQSFGAGGYQSQYSDGQGNIKKYDFPAPNEQDVHDTMRQWKEQE